MTSFEKAVAIAVKSIKDDALMCGVEWNCVFSWPDLLDWMGTDSAGMREDIHHDLMRAANMGNLDVYPMDNCSIEDTDGTIKSYRQLTNAIRKELFA